MLSGFMQLYVIISEKIFCLKYMYLYFVYEFLKLFLYIYLLLLYNFVKWVDWYKMALTYMYHGLFLPPLHFDI